MTTAEKMKRAAERVNSFQKLEPLRHRSDRANKDTRKGGGYVPVARNPDVAEPRRINIWSEGTYKPGDGESGGAVRSGSLVAYTLPSKGIGA
jgi:hypothetical protein